jgi:ABC-2 type transport system permease protein
VNRAAAGPAIGRSRTGRVRPLLSVRAFVAQSRVELLITARGLENVFITLVVPVLLLLFFASVQVLPAPAGLPAIDELAPGILALALISTGQVSLGVATAFERSQGVLKRLGGSPLPAWALLGAKTLAVVVTEIAQVTLVATVAALMGWGPPGGVVPALFAATPWLALGTLTFAAFGLLLAGTLRAEAVLAVASGLYVVFVLLGGVVVPLDRLPPLIAVPASFLPPALFTDLLRGALVPGLVVSPLAAAGLGAWAIGLAAATALAFRVGE